MKKLLLILLTCTLYGCDAGHTTEVEIKNNLKAIQFVHTADSFEVMHGQYKIFTMLRNIGKKRLKNLQLNATYLDENGKELAKSIGGPDAEIMPGDSAIVQTGWMFPTKEQLPYKVILTATN